MPFNILAATISRLWSFLLQTASSRIVMLPLCRSALNSGARVFFPPQTKQQNCAAAKEFRSFPEASLFGVGAEAADCGGDIGRGSFGRADCEIARSKRQSGI